MFSRVNRTVAMKSLDYIIKPLSTQKTSVDQERNVYTFLFKNKATKNDIKQVIKVLYEVDVTSVNTASYSGKPKKKMNYSYRTESFKKAFIKIKKGQSIQMTPSI